MRLLCLHLALLTLLLTAGPARTQPTRFESPPVHPLELDSGGSRLLAVHTDAHRLVVFDLDSGTLQREVSIPVGLEPVTVRARNADEAWVVNHLSDSISIVDLNTRTVRETVNVGDEPTDVLFAGTPERAFVVVSQEDAVLVLDPENPTAPGQRLELMASDPRHLALSPDGSTLYLTVLEGGNRTTAIGFQTVDALGGPPAPQPAPAPGLPAPPRTALIVQQQSGSWVDEAGGSWDAAVPYEVLDHDLVEIDVASRSVVGYVGDLGTTIFNVAVHPQDGSLLVTNQDAFNLTRFEPNLKGRFARNQVTQVVGATVTPRHLNEHIDYANQGGTASERSASLSFPLDIVFDDQGSTAYVAAFSSAQVGVLGADGQVLQRWAAGNGPAGLAYDRVRSRLYVLDHIDATVRSLRLADGGTDRVTELGYDGVDEVMRDGRRIFYDARVSSAHGDLSCNSCHLFGGMDNLAWDLGDPQGEMTPPPPGQLAQLPDFHPMKGPMTTQSLKGLADTEPLHWRGDRTVFADFNGAFVSLMGRDTPLADGDFGAMEDFVFSMAYPPNPFRELDGTLPSSIDGSDPGNGESLYLSGNLVGGLECVTCHALPSGENGQIIPAGALLEDEAKVVPQLRNMYEKTRFDAEAPVTLRGFGYTHDGAVDDLFTFLDFPAFNFASANDQQDVVAFLLAFDTGTPAAVGAQWATADGGSDPRLGTLVGLADLAVVGLIAKTTDDLDQELGWVYTGGGLWAPNRASETPLSTASLLARASSLRPITVTAVVEGTQSRLGIDRDEDTFLDGDEIDAGSDPGGPLSTPDTVPTAVDPDGWLTGRYPELWLAGSNPAGVSTRLGLRVPSAGELRLEIFDVRGRRVRTLARERAAASVERVFGWDLRDGDGRTVPSGVYLARLSWNGETRTRRLSVVR